MKQVFDEHKKTLTIFFVPLLLFIFGVYLFGTDMIMFIIWILLIILAILVFIALSMIYCQLFLKIKGISKSDSYNVDSASILPWLKFTSEKNEHNWKMYLKENE